MSSSDAASINSIAANPTKPPKRLPFLGPAARVALTVTLVIAVAFVGMLWLLQSAQNESAERERIAQMRLVSGAITSSFDQLGKFALALAETGARRAAVTTALAASDRPALQRLSQSAYDYLKQQAGIQIYGFHSKDLRYLLRMHRPDAFDDDISASRPMVVAANKSKRAQTGIEIGLGGIGVRGIAVVNHENEFAGTMEIGLDIRPILDLVKASTNADIAVVIVPSMTGVALDDKTPRFGDLNLAMSTDSDLFTALLTNHRLKPARDVEIADLRIDGRRYNMVTQPLVDFSGRLVGMTIALKDDARAGVMRVRTELWVAAASGCILAYAIFAILLQTILMRRRGAQ